MYRNMTLLFFTTIFICAQFSYSCYPRGKNDDRIIPSLSYDAIATNKSCNYGRGKIIHIGITNHSFTPKIHVCFDNTTSRTFWTTHYLGHTNNTNFTNSRTCWSRKFFSKFNPDSVYKQVSYNTDRGHLSPRADFNTDAERKMTYYYINAAPQARKLNQGNWKSLEIDVRMIANTERKPLKIITGSGGSLFSLNTFNFTYPEYFFKILIFDSGRKDVFVGVNNASFDVNLQGNFTQSVCKTVIPFCGCFGRNGGVVYCCEFDKQLMQRFGLEFENIHYKERW